MNRRSFLRGMIGGVAAAAAVREFPFRVFSFPTEVVPINAVNASPLVAPSFDSICATTLAELRQDILYDNFFVDTPWLKLLKSRSPYPYKAAGMQVPFTYEQPPALPKSIVDELDQMNREMLRALSLPR